MRYRRKARFVYIGEVTQVFTTGKNQISRGTINRSVHRDALSVAAWCRKATPPPLQVFGARQSRHSALHFVWSEVSPILRHRLKNHCFALNCPAAFRRRRGRLARRAARFRSSRHPPRSNRLGGLERSDVNKTCWGINRPGYSQLSS